ncbi:uncharacterized protein JCM10292_004459 [Rhodotorula paludigena]|uniref:uncharacterized protein n=1 Tax=Rhodotorula paludigena TaxID=86838 RepID=UPI00316F9FFF
MPLNRGESPYHRPQDPRLARRRAKEDEAALKQERATPTLAGPSSSQSGSPAHANAGAGGSAGPSRQGSALAREARTASAPYSRAMSVKPVLPSRGMNKPRDAFSSTQLNDARRRIGRVLRDGNELKPKDFPRCHTCTNAQIKEIFCVEADVWAAYGDTDSSDSDGEDDDKSGAPKQRPGWSAEQAYGVPPPPAAGAARQESGSAKPDQWSAGQEQKTMPTVIYEDEDEW